MSSRKVSPHIQGQSAFESFESATEIYLDKLADSAPETTFWSHKSAVTEFCDWYQTNSVSKSFPNQIDFVEFIDYVQAKSGFSSETIASYTPIFANLRSFIHRQDPEILKFELLSGISEYNSMDLHEIIGENSAVINSDGDFNRSEHIASLLTYLRQRQFGTRVHAYAELIVDVNGRPTVIKEIELEDISLEDGLVSVSIPETHLVSRIDLVNRRVAQLSPSTIETIEEYVTYERKEPTKADSQPLFTTTHGRASEATLRRSLKHVSEDQYNHLLTTDRSQCDQIEGICPCDLWQHSISKLVGER